MGKCFELEESVWYGTVNNYVFPFWKIKYDKEFDKTEPESDWDEDNLFDGIKLFRKLKDACVDSQEFGGYKDGLYNLTQEIQEVHKQDYLERDSENIVQCLFV